MIQDKIDCNLLDIIVLYDGHPIPDVVFRVYPLLQYYLEAKK